MGYFVDPPKWWTTAFGDKIYPNTIADYEVNKETGLYDWVIEVQCTDGKNIIGQQSVSFVGINFYSRIQNPSEESYNNMIQRAADRGLDFYYNQNFGLTKVPQDNCKNFPHPTKKLELLRFLRKDQNSIYSYE